MGKTYVGDTSVRIELETNADLSGAATVSIVALKPDGETEVEWTATIDGSLVVYVPTTGDLDVEGTWRLQAKVVDGSGGSALGETAKLKVYPPFH
jgi:hypothetical protein